MESTVAKHSYKTSITGDQRMAEKVEDTESGEMNDPMNDPKLKAVCSVIIERSNSLDVVWNTKEERTERLSVKRKAEEPVASSSKKSVNDPLTIQQRLIAMSTGESSEILEKRTRSGLKPSGIGFQLLQKKVLAQTSQGHLDPNALRRKAISRSLQQTNAKADNVLNNRIDHLVLVKRFSSLDRSSSALETTAEDVIRNSAFLSRVGYSIDTLKTQDTWKCIIRISNRIIATVLNADKMKSIQDASIKALSILERFQHQMIIIKPTNASAHDILLNLEATLGVADDKKISGVNRNPLEKPSVALNMMKMMGWSAGCGLGAKEQGIKEPIKATVGYRHSFIGLGYERNKSSKANALRLSMIDWVHLLQSRRGHSLLQDISLISPKNIKRNNKYLTDDVEKILFQEDPKENEHHTVKLEVSNEDAIKLPKKRPSSNERDEHSAKKLKTETNSNRLVSMIDFNPTFHSGNAAYKPIPNFVLMKLRDIMNEESEDESNGASIIIEKSARSSNVRYQMDTFSRPLSAWNSMILLDGQVIAHCVDKEEEQAVHNVSLEALKLLEKFHYQLIFKKLNAVDPHEEYLANLNEAIEKETPGQKMDGECDIVGENFTRATIGSVQKNKLNKKIDSLLSKYISEDHLHKLEFNDFTAQEQDIIRRKAEKFDLLHYSIGSDDNRQLIVKKREQRSLIECVDMIKSKENNPLFKDILVIPPQQSSALFYQAQIVQQSAPIDVNVISV